MGLSEKKRELLIEFCDSTCESCNKYQKDGKLFIHSINRGYMGGKYVLRNIMVICFNCHTNFHYREFRR